MKKGPVCNCSTTPRGFVSGERDPTLAPAAPEVPAVGVALIVAGASDD